MVFNHQSCFLSLAIDNTMAFLFSFIDNTFLDVFVSIGPTPFSTGLALLTFIEKYGLNTRRRPSSAKITHPLCLGYLIRHLETWRRCLYPLLIIMFRAKILEVYVFRTLCLVPVMYWHPWLNPSLRNLYKRWKISLPKFSMSATDESLLDLSLSLPSIWP